MFRDNIQRDTELGRQAKPLLERGELVPDEIVLGMVEDRIAQPDCANGFVFDGFPRTLPQADDLERICQAAPSGLHHRAAHGRGPALADAPADRPKNLQGGRAHL